GAVGLALRKGTRGRRRGRACVSRQGNVQGVCRAGRTTCQGRDQRRAGGGDPPGLYARTRLRGPRRRTARRGDRETDDSGDRPTGRGARSMKLVYEKSRPGRRASSLPRPDLPAGEVPEELRRSSPPRLPEIAEPELLRHFTALADSTFGVDTGFYPLGSCTMKHNPRVNERVVNLPGFRDLHPLQQEDASQGALELMWRFPAVPAPGGRRPGGPRLPRPRPPGAPTLPALTRRCVTPRRLPAPGPAGC